MRAAIEVLRIFSDVLKDNVVGFNAQQAVVPRTGDPVLPPVTHILCEADDNIQVTEKPAGGWPILTVAEQDDNEMDVDPDAVVGYRDGIVRVVVVWVTEKKYGAETYRRSKYAAQAVADSIQNGLLAPDKLDVVGKRNNISIENIQRLTAPKVEVKFEHAMAGAVVRYEVQFRDHTP